MSTTLRLRLSPQQIEAIKTAKEAGKSIRRTARELGIGVGAVQHHWPRREAVQQDRKWTEDTRGEAANLEFTTDRPVRTLEDALRFAEVDQTRWYVSKWECTSWECVTKLKGQKDKPDGYKRHHLWRVKLELRLRLPRALMEAAEAIYERISASAPEPSPRVAWKPQKILCEISLFDHHFGKLAWGVETGQDYDLRIAETLYRNAVEDLLDLTESYKAEEYLFTIGQDLFHVDSQSNTTTAGTPQDTDGRLAKIVDVVERSVSHAIRALASRAKVRVVWVKSNHDALTSYFLARVMAAEFRRDDRVTVDHSPSSRKYVRYGTNLIGLTHGHLMSPRDLPLTMARERPRDWAECSHYEWHLGHWHTQKKFETLPSEEKSGVIVRVLPSLSGTDAWHHEQGYVGNRRAAECYLYDAADGYFLHTQALARM